MRAGRREQDTRVEHAHSAGVGDDRVEVHLAHLGMRGRELGNRSDEAGERVEVGGRAAADAAQHRRAAQFAEHRARAGGGYRRDPKRGILENLD